VQVKVSARHGQLSDEHQAEIAEKAEKLLTYFERISMIEVTVDLANHDTKHQMKVEILVNAEHKHDFVAHHSDPDLSAAVNGAIDKIKQQVKHYKEKVQDHRRNPSHGGEGGIKP
jgi:putative sigma-54 modulation protein